MRDLVLNKYYLIQDKYGNNYQVQFLGYTPQYVKINHVRIGKMSYYNLVEFEKEHKIIKELIKEDIKIFQDASS